MVDGRSCLALPRWPIALMAMRRWQVTHRDLDCVLSALRNLSAGTVVEYFGIRIIRNANESESEMIDEERQIGEAMAALPVIGRRLYGLSLIHISEPTRPY